MKVIARAEVSHACKADMLEKVNKVIKTQSFSWVVLLVWVMFSFVILKHFDPPKWIASYCQTGRL